MKKYCVLVMVMVFTFSLSVMAQSPTPHQNFRVEKKEMRHGVRPMFDQERRAGRMARELEFRSINTLLEKNEAKMLQELSLLK